MAGPLTEINAIHAVTKILGVLNVYHGETLAGATTLDGTYPNVIKLDPGGASRNVTLPAETGRNGVFYVVANGADAAENLVMKDPAANTVCTINQNEAALIVCNGTQWYCPFLFTIALS